MRGTSDRSGRSGQSGWIAAIAVGAAGVAAGGCGPSAKNQMIDVVPIATARDAYFTARYAAAGATGGADPACPVRTVVGTMTMIAGGCVDAEGVEFTGSAVIDGDPNGDFTATWSEFGRLPAESDCDGEPGDSRTIVDGTATVSGTATGSATFDVDLRETRTGPEALGCAARSLVESWDYTGTITYGGDSDGDGVIDELTFDGSGVVTRDDDGNLLSVEASTEAQLMDRTVCDQEPLSGTTTLVAGDHTGVVTNDGATDCDDPPTGAFTFDGEDEGEVAVGGVCTIVRAGGAGTPGSLAALLAALGLGIVLRRSRP